MGCVSADSLQRFIEGALQPERLAEVELHLDGCAACRELLAASARSAFSPDIDEGAPQRIGRYLLQKPIGTGGMGTVYAAFDPQLERRVAIKLLHATASTPYEAEELRQRLLREGRAQALISHPNVLPVFEVGESGEEIFLVVELAARGSLADALAAQPQPSRDQILDLFLGAGRGLAAAHEAGLVHRDFKPANVLLGPDARPMVTDFGLARSIAGPPQPVADPDEPARAPQSTAAGSLAYMAPEQLRGESVDPRADLFAFSCALHQALSGERPFAGEDALQLLRSIEAGEIRASTKDAIPLALRRVLLRGLRADPNDRFASMGEMLEAVERARHVVSRRRARAALTAALLGAMLAAVFLVRQELKIDRLAGEKAALDRSIAQVLAQLEREQDPAKLKSLDRQLASLSGDAESRAVALGVAAGDPSQPDQLNREIQAVLDRFGAGTYAVPPSFEAQVQRHIDRLLAQPSLKAQWARKRLYWDRMVKPFRALGLPEEMAYVAWAESGFDPESVSPSGATGLFQFMPDTAERFHLAVRGPVDERRSVEKSSDAAAHYLAQLIAELGSDSFLLAVASYNAGESMTRAALDSLATEPGGFAKDQRDFWHLYLRKLLPEETREYVFEVLAAIIVGTHAHRYGLE